MFIDYYLKQLGGKLIFSCNLRKDDISHINISNEFLKELLEIWTEVHFIQSNGLEENNIKNQLIWYNSCIRVENKPIYYKNWAASGIIKIKDLLDNENDILDFGKFQKKFNNLKANYLDFIRIISLIEKLLNPLQPRLGKKREQTKIITIQEAASGSKLNRVVYSVLLKNIATVPQKSQLKWARDLEACQKNEIHKIWLENGVLYIFFLHELHKFENVPFQYLHRRIPTNTFLMKCKISPKEKCTFCKSEPETTIHLFFQCSYVNVFWQTIIRWIKSFPNQKNINFSKAMQLGLQTCETSVLNLIMLTAKHFIFTCKLRKQNPTLSMYRQTLNSVFVSEREIASKTGKVLDLTRKWKPFYTL